MKITLGVDAVEGHPIAIKRQLASENHQQGSQQGSPLERRQTMIRDLHFARKYLAVTATLYQD